MPRLTTYLTSISAKLTALFGRGLVMSMGIVLLLAFLASVAILLFMNSTAPDTITITTGPKGSLSQRNAEKYKAILEKEGVMLKILSSEGSVDNLKKLTDPKINVDVGFVLSGEAEGINIDKLVSLGSVSYQPLMIFYHGKTKALLSDFKGKRLDIGPEGSGTRALALSLLKANGILPNDGTILTNSVSGDAVRALIDNRIDAIFVMGDSTSGEMMRELLHSNDIHLFNFTQAEGYARRFNNLNKMELPKGSIDFGKDIPAEDTYLIGPTIELVAREGLHPALSDVLLEAVKEVHSTPTILRKRGEFPAPLEHEFRISPDAARYYTSGKSYLYRTFPFAVASLIARVLAVIVPVGLLLIPAIRLVPAIYRWRMEARINKWYRSLLNLERDAFKEALTPKRRDELLRHLNHIEHSVSKIVIPARFGNLLYGLREHIDFVRSRLLTGQSAGLPN